jgi:hypothetical protein
MQKLAWRLDVCTPLLAALVVTICDQSASSGCVFAYNGVFFFVAFAVLPSSTYLFTAGVEGFYFHLITLRHTPQLVGLLWTRDRPVAETST